MPESTARPNTPFDPSAQAGCAEVPPKDTSPKTVFAREVVRGLQAESLERVIAHDASEIDKEQLKKDLQEAYLVVMELGFFLMLPKCSPKTIVEVAMRRLTNKGMRNMKEAFDNERRGSGDSEKPLVPTGIPATGLIWRDLTESMQRLRDIQENKIAMREAIHPSFDQCYARLKEAKMWLENFMSKES